MGTLAVPIGTVAYIDANTLIYAVEGIAPYAAILRPVWEAGKSKQARLIASELLIIEVLTGPIKQTNRSLVSAYEQILGSSDLELVPVTPTILRDGASIRANHGVKTPDAIHAATALAAGCSMFLTNDLGFRRIPGISVIILSEI